MLPVIFAVRTWICLHRAEAEHKVVETITLNMEPSLLEIQNTVLVWRELVWNYRISTGPFPSSLKTKRSIRQCQTDR